MRRIARVHEVRTWLPGLAWAAGVYAFHKYGAIVGWYTTYPWFQNLTHAASASGVVVVLFLLGRKLGYRGRRLAGFVIALTALGTLGWEAVEYLGWLDQYGVYLMFHGVQDMAVDMASNAVGSLIALAALLWWTNRDTGGDTRPVRSVGTLRDSPPVEEGKQ